MKVKGDRQRSLEKQVIKTDSHNHTNVCIPRSAWSPTFQNILSAPLLQRLGLWFLSTGLWTCLPLKTGSSSSEGITCCCFFFQGWAHGGHFLNRWRSIWWTFWWLKHETYLPEVSVSRPARLMISSILEDAASVPSLLEPRKGGSIVSDQCFRSTECCLFRDGSCSGYSFCHQGASWSPHWDSLLASAPGRLGSWQ